MQQNQNNTFGANQTSSFPLNSNDTNQSGNPTTSNNFPLDNSQNLNQNINQNSNQNDSQVNLLNSIPLTFPQQTLSSILSQLESSLESDIANYKKKAEQIFILDNQIIKSRNNYVKLMNRVNKEEESMKELEENIEYMEKWVDELEKKDSSTNDFTYSNTLNEINQVEQQFDEIMNVLKGKNDIENNLQGIISENLRLLRCIDEEMEMFE